MQNIARDIVLYPALFIEQDFILPFSSGMILSDFIPPHLTLSRLILPHPTLSHFILPYPTLSYFFAHTMISLGGKLLKCLLYAKALLRGELSAQQTEGFQTSPIADSKIRR